MTRIWIFALAVVAAVVGGPVPAHAAEHSAEHAAEHSRAFVVYDNVQYRNVNLEPYGAVRLNLVDEGAVDTLTGPGRGEMALPRRAAYENLVRRLVTAGGPVVLDFESLYLRGDKATALRHYTKMMRLLVWTRDAEPGRTVGVYGLLGHTDPRYDTLARKLARWQDAFFPSLYTFSSNPRVWRATLARDLAEARTVAPNKPVYLYLWPQYHDFSPYPGRYLPPRLWRYELATARRAANGVVIWGPRARNTDTTWLSAL